MNIDPVAISIGPLKIYWYAVSYVFSIICGIQYCKYIAKVRNVNIHPELFDLFVNYLVAGIIIGGRLGHVLFFDLEYYINHISEIFCIWKGGMSFHGGCIGTFCAIIIFCKKYSINTWLFTDIISCAAPIGVFFGRIANFVNQELYGIPTNSCLGVIFRKIDLIPRHPVQIYEALTEGLLLFILMFYLAKQGMFKNKLSGIFLIGYSVPRFFIEYLKASDTNFNLYLTSSFHISVGQLISCIFCIIGLLIIHRLGDRKC